MGFIKSYVLGCVSIGKAYEMVARISPKMVRSCTFESVRLAPNKAKVVVTPRPGAQEKLYQCENRIGYFEALCTLFRHKFPQVEHTKCCFKGDDYCEFVVTWREFKYEMWKKVRTFGGIVLLAIAGALFFLDHQVGLAVISATLLTLLAFSSRLWRLERRELRDGIENLSNQPTKSSRRWKGASRTWTSPDS